MQCLNLAGHTKINSDHSKSNIVNLLNRWKQIDVTITEQASEAKDNVRKRFVEILLMIIP
jgi:hypothetical protein